MSGLTAETWIQRSDTVLSSPLSGAIVMMNIESGNYFDLDGTGARIWSLIESPRTVGDLCDELMVEFDVDRETCLSQVIEFIGELSANNLVSTLGE